MNQELVTYIVLGSESRLKNIKLPLANKYEEYLLANFSSNASYQNQLDDLVTRSKGEVVVFLPPSSFPNIEAKEALKKIALIGLSSWGWFEYSLKRKNILQNIRKKEFHLDVVMYLEKVNQILEKLEKHYYKIKI